MKLLIVTNLFPNAREPGRAAYHLQQFTALSRLCELKVVAPLPYFRYSDDEVPAVEMINGIEVFHPRYLVIPKILRLTYGLAFFAGIWHTLTSVRRSFSYDVILAAWAYPDAFGTALAAKFLGKKFYAMALGSDINIAGQSRLRAAMIRWAFKRAEKIIAVSQPLKVKIAAMGVPAEKIMVLTNGVDTGKFHVRDKVSCREALKLDPEGRYILYVGNFAAVKGVEYLVQALALLAPEPAVRLLLVGDGEERARLKDLARGQGVADRVVFAGRKPHAEISGWMGAADVFCLPSLNEGCPNVLLEALACGIKVVASHVGGVPDVMDTPQKGWLVRPKDPAALAQALRQALEAPPLAGDVRIMSWDENAARLYAMINGPKGDN